MKDYDQQSIDFFDKTGRYNHVYLKDFLIRSTAKSMLSSVFA